ncbi:hypothetical protein FRX31_002354 [Thalictrum thalictroides]|uniref:RING-type domain-containing protein n=1 Tax=Thalictrum thalictroides TaxID=46969 RepID=A0A7J6XE21_THATH|nr:hypothetical protein FRX31_002354 [Thalictrum thalictroides]
MEIFLGQVTARAPAMNQARLDGFFGTIKTKLQQKFIDENYVSQGYICSDLELRVINQLLSYHNEHFNERVEGEFPNVSEIRLRWMNKLAIFAKSQLQGGEMVETSSIEEELQKLLTPMQKTWHGCYHCGSFFKRQDVLSLCPMCDGWLLVEIDSNVEDDDDDYEFMYTYAEAVPWEFERLTSGGVSALRSFEEFEVVDNRERKECPICIQSDEHVEDGWKLTFCKHILGYSCLEAWLNNNLTCPVCRSEFPGDNYEGPLAELYGRSRNLRTANAELESLMRRL